jgi:branched-chain amino acid transport system substrate-binding protein
MHQARTSSRRLIIGSLAFAFAGAACSIQAPNVQLISQGANGQPVPIATGGAAVTNQPGALPGATAQIPGAAPVTGSSPVTGAQAQACVGKATDTGVTGNQIKLGSNFAVSGPVSNISGPILKGVQAYFNKVNAQGGIYGRKIFLKWYDDGWDAQRGKAYIKRLVEQDKVFVLATVPSSNGLDAAVSYLEQRQMPVFGTTGLIESQFRSSMQWPVGTSSKSAARIGLVDAKRLGAKSDAVIWLDLLAGEEGFQAIKNGVKPIIGKDAKDFLVNTNGYRVSISEPDFGPVWTRIQQDTRAFQAAHGMRVDGRPDIVQFAIDPTNAIKALQAAENIGFRPKIRWEGAAPLFLDLVPQGSDYAAKTGLVAGTSYFPPIAQYRNLAAVQDYIKTVQRYYGPNVDLNNPYLEGGYAGAALTVEIMRRVGPCLTRKAAISVANNITNYSAAGLTPALSFRPVGQGSGHFGNIRGLLVQVDANSDWRPLGDFILDPRPGTD